VNIAETLAELLAQPEGRISPSIYETGRVVSRAPWLAGHRERLEFLLGAQNPDGTWGGPDEFGLVPTLSAVEAIRTSLERDRPDPASRERLRGAADAGLRALLDQGPAERLPDTVAVELIVPVLVEKLNEHLAASGESRWAGARLSLPRELDPGLLAKARAALAAGVPIPTKLHHSLEVIGAAASAAPTVAPVQGSVGCSPAATVAWLGDEAHRAAHPAVMSYLDGLVDRYGGPVPSVVPITVFERAWVLAELARAGTDVPIPPALLDSLDAAVAHGATPGAPGLPPDADTTSATLATLAQLGRRRRPDTLYDYETDTHFCCWHGEKTASPTANAHVLEALAEHPDHEPGADRARAAMVKIAGWLADVQLADGSWTDKWHASPYYATACCVPALYLAGGPRSANAIRRAVDRVLGTQHPDGSWGRWAGTAEETAYAIRVLLHDPSPVAEAAVARGHEFLLNRSTRFDLVPLWQDKDLYCPTAVVATTIEATLSRLRNRWSPSTPVEQTAC
jgi:halimadienyl-diphosphate synthase